MVDNIDVNEIPSEVNLAVFQFIELLTLISILSIVFIVFLLLFLKNKEKNKELEEKNKEERLIFETITDVQESERNRISHDLHDTVTQDVRTAILFIHKIQNSKDFEQLTQEQKDSLEKIHQIEEQNLKNIRNIIRNLTPPEIENANIVQLVSEFCMNASQSGGIPCKIYAERSELYNKLTEEQKLHVFRIIQESVNNAVKHSGASEISVIVREEFMDNKKRLVFLVSDDGSGFSRETGEQLMEKPESIESDRPFFSEGTHLGLRGMKSRAILLGAELTIKGDAESGTQVKLTLPVE